MRRVVVLLAIAGLSTALWAGAGLSLPRSAAATDGPAMLLLAQGDDVKPLAQILATIGKEFPGHALDAQLVKQGEPKYRVKWLGEDGKVREVTSDAKSGKILDVR